MALRVCVAAAPAAPYAESVRAQMIGDSTAPRALLGRPGSGDRVVACGQHVDAHAFATGKVQTGFYPRILGRAQSGYATSAVITRWY